MDVNYTDEDVLKPFRYPKWVVGFSLFVLAIFVYSLSNISDLMSLSKLENKAIRIFHDKNYLETNILVDSLEGLGIHSNKLTFLKAGCVFGLKDTSSYDGALHLIKISAHSINKQELGLLNNILSEQGYILSILAFKQLSLVTLNDIKTGNSVKQAK